MYNFSVIAVSETWGSNDNMSLLSIPGYNSTFKSRTSERGSGVALFVCNYFNSLYLSIFNNDNF